MPASRVNYIVCYKGYSQIFGTASKEIALSTPPPDGVDIDRKLIYFTTVDPENNELCVYKVPDEEVKNAELVYPKRKKKTDE